ncbi:unnamed protein product [Rangifer tarandus platyrhynchus]|uniref:Uncharacterized protein n=1 Tax=Rangifer tarandus platyrhynchus TaxID=3082113 RepID=A0ACB1MMQ7_RANTA
MRSGLLPSHRAFLCSVLESCAEKRDEQHHVSADHGVLRPDRAEASPESAEVLPVCAEEARPAGVFSFLPSASACVRLMLVVLARPDPERDTPGLPPGAPAAVSAPCPDTPAPLDPLRLPRGCGETPPLPRLTSGPGALQGGTNAPSSGLQPMAPSTWNMLLCIVGNSIPSWQRARSSGRVAASLTSLISRERYRPRRTH